MFYIPNMNTVGIASRVLRVTRREQIRLLNLCRAICVLWKLKCEAIPSTIYHPKFAYWLRKLIECALICTHLCIHAFMSQFMCNCLRVIVMHLSIVYSNVPWGNVALGKTGGFYMKDVPHLKARIGNLTLNSV